MASQALLPSDPPLELQRDVQRKLGRCLLRLQQYEILLKALVAHGDVAGPPAALQSVQDAQVACAQKKTLGSLVGMLTERHLTSAEEDDGTDEPQGDGGTWFRFRFQVGLDASQHQAATAALKELVDLRNELVHHFLQRFNIWEQQGCIAADAYLDTSYETIDCHYLTLRGWAQGMEEARAAMASFMSTAAFEDLLVNGIAPDGTVGWPASGAVRCLREAETQFATEGWTLLNTATLWIREHHPDQHPQRYGCGSWRQVIHESRQFEIRRTVNIEQGCGEVWYRSRQEEAIMQGKKRS
ncbi:OST-HTH/LOTUS domain-containing protein [Stenotrophomonas sp.]|uniref:OST-HTH/LOTUS domain-containing protein n=1 Tax=Stenotrophomonas sp. TaxID=69392 RepID=UPI00289E5046|nr:OST-HTH/LOTUS domain-containing protein [Stenotrophomonas sp.]